VIKEYGGNALMVIVTGVISMPTIKDMDVHIAQDSYRQEQEQG